LFNLTLLAVNLRCVQARFAAGLQCHIIACVNLAALGNFMATQGVAFAI
jgi:hypothetical protein